MSLCGRKSNINLPILQHGRCFCTVVDKLLSGWCRWNQLLDPGFGTKHFLSHIVLLSCAIIPARQLHAYRQDKYQGSWHGLYGNSSPTLPFLRHIYRLARRKSTNLSNTVLCAREGGEGCVLHIFQVYYDVISFVGVQIKPIFI